MNRERCKELLPIMQAFADGKDIEYMSGSGAWIACPSPSWSISNNYRIKPEPKTGWINVYTGKLVSNIHSTKNDADDNATHKRVACIQITYTEGEGL